MPVFGAIDFDGHEQVSFFYDRKTGLKAIIAIHNTWRGPALGGCRMWPYKDEQDALTDVLRLSKGMTYKAALANLPYGGGKIVIIGDSHHDKAPALFRAVGRCVNQFHGRFITGEDVGTSPKDMAYIRETTTHVVGLPGGIGDPSPYTAIGVYEGIRAAAAHRLKKESLEGLKIAVQGLGHVGYHLCKLLHKAGVELVVTDIDDALIQKTVKAFKATAVAPDDIYKAEVDVFSPCALGAIINDHSIPQFKCKVIVGSANNQLENHEHGEILARMKILYGPDYVVNSGGLIDVSYDGPNYNPGVVLKHVQGIYDTLLDIFHRAEKLKLSTSEAADHLAEERFKK